MSTHPFHFWASNFAYIDLENPLNNAEYKFDSIVVVTSELSKINELPRSSFLSGFIDVLKRQKECDAAFETVDSFLVANVPQYESIQKLVFSPTGPLDRHYDDVRRFGDAANTGIKRILKSGAKRPLLAVLFPENDSSRSNKFKLFDFAAILGAAEAVYVPLEIREDVPAKCQKVEFLGVASYGGNGASPVPAALEMGRIVARDIGGSDPERMSAPNVARYVQETFANTPVKVEVVEDDAVILREYPLLAAVNRATRGVERHRARVIFLTYEPPAPHTKTIVLVGKGVTYDTGGADVKAGGVMAGMHRDKCGAAAVAGFLKTVAELRPKYVKVIAAMSMVRNSIGSECYVSDEIITSRCGMRVRVGNTDAEGRMAMADVLCHMKEKVLNEKNPELFTIATLTGHACLAVGRNTIIMNNGPAEVAETATKMQKAGDKIGFPVEISHIRREDYDFHKGKSEYEDLLQCNNLPSSQTPRGHQSPGAFLIMASGLDKHDINSSKPLKYSHVDIAGSSGPFPGIPSGDPIPAFTYNFLLD